MFVKSILAVLALAASPLTSPANLAANDDITGRWDITIQDASGTQYPSWFEVTRQNGKLVGRFVGRTGSQRPIKTIEFDDGILRFSLPIQYEPQKSDLRYEAKLDGDRLEGTTLDREGKTLKWTAKRSPNLKVETPRWGKPVKLFNGRDLSGWKVRDPKKAGTWKVIDGVLENTARGTDLITERAFDDFKLHVEFRMVERGNSGVYLRGRYEVQIQDDFGKQPTNHGIGGIYGFIKPSANPAKKHDEWQTFDITLIGRTVTVALNGTTVINKAEIPGITGGALDSNEAAPGPIMLQGDHQKIYYRSIVLTPAKVSARAKL